MKGILIDFELLVKRAFIRVPEVKKKNHMQKDRNQNYR